MLLLILVGIAALAALVAGAFKFSQRRAMGDTAAIDTQRKIKGRSKSQRTQQQRRRLGYRYADDRIFIQGGGVFCGVILDTSSTEFATSGEMSDIAMMPVGLEQDLLKLFDGQPVPCQELVRYRSLTTEGWRRQLIANAWNPTEMYRVLVEKVADHIKGSTPQRMWTLIVRLGDLPQQAAVDPQARVATEILGVAEEKFSRKTLAPWWSRADAVHHLAAARGADPLTRRDLLWLVRKPGYGHLAVPDEPVIRRRPWRGGYFELATTLRGRRLGGGLLELHQLDPDTGEDGISYTATLVVTDQPARQVFRNRNAWMPRVSRLTNPVEISWRYTLVPAEQWKRTTDKAAVNIEDERQDREKAGVQTDEAFEARLGQADTLRQDPDDPKPGMIGRLRFSVSAPTRKLLVKAIADLKQAMGQVEVTVPEHASLALLQEQLPGEGLLSDLGSLSAGSAGGLRLWERHSDTFAPALALLGSHDQVGDRITVERGRPLGWIGMAIAWVKSNGTAVHQDPHAQVARLNGAGIAVLGSSGGGKSSYALDQFFWMSESGVLVNVLDPKIEFRNFVLYIAFGPQVLLPGFMDEADAGTLGTSGSRFQPINRQFWDETEIIDLARGARGTRDPWRISRKFIDGYNLALNLTDALFLDAEHRRIVKKGLRALRNAYKAAEAEGHRMSVGFGDVVDYIRIDRDELAADLDRAKHNNNQTNELRSALDTIDEVIARLENGEELPFLRLLLGKGSDPDAQDSTAKNRLIRRRVFTLAGFKQPDNPDDPESWTDEDRNASAAMMIVLEQLRGQLSGRLVPNPVTGRPGIPPTATIVDEANVLAAMRAGRWFVVVVLRQGRSLNHVLFFLAQQPRDVKAIEEMARKDDPAEVNQFGSILMFRQRSLSEARSALELLRSSGNEMSNSERDELARKLLSEQVPDGNLRPGQCVLRDPDSRVSTVVVDQFFYVLQHASQTNAKLVPIDWAHEVPADPRDWEINTRTLLEVRTAVAEATEEYTDDWGADDLVDWEGDPDGDYPNYDPTRSRRR